ncbi:11846_t:CDS:1, partial [Scutellospora calospora]
KLLSTHQNANKKSSIETSNKLDKYTIDLTTENSHFSKYARVENTEDDNNLYKQNAECSKVYISKNNKYDSDIDIIDESKYVIHNHGKINRSKEEIAQSVVYNTRS